MIIPCVYLTSVTLGGSSCDLAVFFQIDWQPKSLTFSIDGKVVRTINQADAVDSSGVSRFPNSPSRIQLSYAPILT